MKDFLFLDPGRRRSDFAFDDSVAAVFDDMIERSVPFYFEIQNMLVDLALHYRQPGTSIYDLGCSTGTTLALLRARDACVPLVGIDNAPAMLNKARAALDARQIGGVELRSADLNDSIAINNASVAILNLVLQFVQPERRLPLMQSICRDLPIGGCLLLVEKTVVEDADLNNCFVEAYHAFKKRNLYSEVEIARKRESLENILQPWTQTANRELLSKAGFATVEPFFQWFNFWGLIAVKSPA